MKTTASLLFFAAAALGMTFCHFRGRTAEKTVSSAPQFQLNQQQDNLIKVQTASSSSCRIFDSPKGWRGTVTVNLKETTFSTTALTLNCQVFMKVLKGGSVSLEPDYQDSHAVCSYTYSYVWPPLETVRGKGKVSNGLIGMFTDTTPACRYRLTDLSVKIPVVIHFTNSPPQYKKIKTGADLCFGSPKLFPGGHIPSKKFPPHFGPLAGKITCIPFSKVLQEGGGVSGIEKVTWVLNPVLE
jgi:hypothetical protein